MTAAPMQMVINIFAAIGFKITGIVIKGLILYGGWLFFILAFLGLLMTAFYGFDDKDAFGSLIKRIAAILVAVALFYLPVHVNLTNVIAGTPGLSSTTLSNTIKNDPIFSHALNYSSGGTGAVNAVTYLAYTLSHPLVDLAMKIGGSNSDIWPGIQSSIDADLSSAMQASNPQVAANLAQWRYVLAPAILRADPVLATIMEKDPQYKYVFFNPYSTNKTLDPQYGQDASVLKILMDKYPPKPSFQELVLQNQSELAHIAGEFGATPFTAKPSKQQGATPSSITVKLFGKHLWKENQEAAKEVSNEGKALDKGNTEFFDIINPPFLGIGDQSTAGKELTNWISDADTNITDFFGGGSYKDATKKFSSLSDLYTNLGRSVLVASIEGYAKNPKAMAALQSMCASHGATDCVSTLHMFSNSVRRPNMKMGDTPGVSGFLGKTLADLGSFTITGLLELVFYSIGAMFNVAAPYIIGFVMAGAILVSVIGPLWMLMAGRFMHALEWMVAPVVFVNLWDALFYIWVLICNAFDNVIPGLAGSINASQSGVGIVKNPEIMNHIVSIGEAMGFLAIPTAAFFLLFGKAGESMRNNFGRVMAAGMTTTATLVGMQLARMATKGGSGKGGYSQKGNQGSNVTGNKPNIPPNNPPSPPGGSPNSPPPPPPGGGRAMNSNAPHSISAATPKTTTATPATSTASTTGNSVQANTPTPSPNTPSATPTVQGNGANTATASAAQGKGPATPLSGNSPHTVRSSGPANARSQQKGQQAPSPAHNKPGTPKGGNVDHNITVQDKPEPPKQ